MAGGDELEEGEISEHDFIWFFANISKHMSLIEQCIGTSFKADKGCYKMNTI